MSNDLPPRRFLRMPPQTGKSSRIIPASPIASHGANNEVLLPFLTSDEPQAASYLHDAPLTALPKGFSLSAYLPPTRMFQLAPKLIMLNSKPIEASLLVLNEECRKHGYGGIFCQAVKIPQGDMWRMRPSGKRFGRRWTSNFGTRRRNGEVNWTNPMLVQ